MKQKTSKMLTFLTALVFCVMAVFGTAALARKADPNTPKKLPLIVIDAGHDASAKA